MNLNEIVRLETEACENNIGFYFKVLYNYYSLLPNGPHWATKLALLCQTLATTGQACTDVLWRETPKIAHTTEEISALGCVFGWPAKVYADLLMYLIAKRPKLPVRDSRSIYYCKGNVACGCLGRFVPEAMMCPKCLGFCVKLSVAKDMKSLWNAHVPADFAFELLTAPRVLLPFADITIDVDEVFHNDEPQPTPDFTLGVRDVPIKQIRKRRRAPQAPPPTAERLLDILTNMASAATPQNVFADYLQTHQRVYEAYIVPLLERNTDVRSELMDGEQCYVSGNYRIIPDHLQKCGPACYFLMPCNTTDMVLFHSADELATFFSPPPAAPPAEPLDEQEQAPPEVEELFNSSLVGEAEKISVVPQLDQATFVTPSTSSALAVSVQQRIINEHVHLADSPPYAELVNSNYEYNHTSMYDEEYEFVEERSYVPPPLFFYAQTV